MFQYFEDFFQKVIGDTNIKIDKDEARELWLEQIKYFFDNRDIFEIPNVADDVPFNKWIQDFVKINKSKIESLTRDFFKDNLEMIEYLNNTTSEERKKTLQLFLDNFCVLDLEKIFNLSDEKNYLDKISDNLFKVKTDKFWDLLSKYCAKLNLKENELYQNANVSAAVFSNIRKMKEKNYRPSKNTALRLCLALHLKLSQAEELLGSIGYSLSSNIGLDRFVIFVLSQGYNYKDVQELNNVIYELTRESPFAEN